MPGRYLADELGLDPGPELFELEQAILTQEAPRPEGARSRRLRSGCDLLPKLATRLDTEPIAARRVVTVLRA